LRYPNQGDDHRERCWVTALSEKRVFCRRVFVFRRKRPWPTSPKAFRGPYFSGNWRGDSYDGQKKRGREVPRSRIPGKEAERHLVERRLKVDHNRIRLGEGLTARKEDVVDLIHKELPPDRLKKTQPTLGPLFREGIAMIDKDYEKGR